ncbi:MAG TPA: tyrosine-protein phosphatase [Anaerolineales bacterium]
MDDQIDIELAIIEQPFRAKRRRLEFSGMKNFRDLGGYHTLDGRSIRWGKLYRSDHLHKMTEVDLKNLSSLDLDRIIDFRAEHEIEEEPDRIPANTNIRWIGIPILDSSTKIWHDSRDELMKDNLKNIDPAKFLIETNIEMVTRFTPQMKQFIQELLSANGRPVLFHCAAGKDRTGYAAALILRILGVPPERVIEDYLLSNEYYLSAYSWNLFVMTLIKGKRFSSVVKGFLEVRRAYLAAAFAIIDSEFGTFEKYVSNGLGLTGQDIEHLRSLYLE